MDVYQPIKLNSQDKLKYLDLICNDMKGQKKTKETFKCFPILLQLFFQIAVAFTLFLNN